MRLALHLLSTVLRSISQFMRHGSSILQKEVCLSLFLLQRSDKTDNSDSNCMFRRYARLWTKERLFFVVSRHDMATSRSTPPFNNLQLKVSCRPWPPVVEIYPTELQKLLFECSQSYQRSIKINYWRIHLRKDTLHATQIEIQDLITCQTDDRCFRLRE